MIAYFLPFFKTFYWFASFTFDKYYLPLVNASKAALNYFRVHITEVHITDITKLGPQIQIAFKRVIGLDL